MMWSSLGSMALPTQMQRHGVQLRTEMAKHSSELTTGRVQAPQRHLRGDLGALSAIEGRLARIAAYDLSIRQSASMLETAQSVLGRVATLGNAMSEQVLTATFADSGGTSYANAAAAARSALDDMVSALSMTVAGRSVFSGAALDRAPLLPAEDIMAAARTHVAGLTQATDIQAALEDFFLAPGGVYETTIYQGEGEAPRVVIDDNQRAPQLPNAMDPAIRSQLMATVMAAMVADDAVPLQSDQKYALAMATVMQLESNVRSVTEVRASIGFSQEILEQRQVRLSVERDSLVQSRHTLIGVDEFESASLLEETRHRLDMLYAITARVSRMSLLEYLR